MAPRVVTAKQAAKVVANGNTLLIGGSGAGASPAKAPKRSSFARCSR